MIHPELKSLTEQIKIVRHVTFVICADGGSALFRGPSICDSNSVDNGQNNDNMKCQWQNKHANKVCHQFFIHTI